MKRYPTTASLAAATLTLTALLVISACSDAETASPTSAPPSSTEAPEPEPEPKAPIVFNGHGNNLDAYTTEAPFEEQRVITNATDDPEGGLDINAQICFYEADGTRYMIAGEDTDQQGAGEPGWGIFEVTGDTVGELEATEVAKLTPTFRGESNPENYGCGILSDGRIVTGDVGNQAGGPGTGQLIIWFPPFDSFDDVAYCKLDVDIGTAGQIAVGEADEVYITSSLGRTEGRPSGVYRYDGPFPTGPTAAEGCGGTDPTGAPLADEVDRTLFIPADHGLSFPAGIMQQPDGGFYVSSQASGVINEYGADGGFVRSIMTPPEGDVLDADGFTYGSPQGLGLGPDGTIYYADIGLVRSEDQGFLEIGPGDGTGTLRRITFDEAGEPSAPEIMDEGLDFPDGIGVLVS